MKAIPLESNTNSEKIEVYSLSAHVEGFCLQTNTQY